jgi:hypothetical protein
MIPEIERKAKRWVKFYYGGVIVAETSTKEVDTIDPCGVKWPKNAYAFTLHEQEVVIIDRVEYKGDSKQIGPMYYHPDSKVETLEEVRENPKATETLVSNMECNRWDKIIWSRWGNWPQAFDPKSDCVLEKR